METKGNTRLRREGETIQKKGSFGTEKSDIRSEMTDGQGDSAGERSSKGSQGSADLRELCPLQNGEQGRHGKNGCGPQNLRGRSPSQQRKLQKALLANAMKRSTKSVPHHRFLGEKEQEPLSARSKRPALLCQPRTVTSREKNRPVALVSTDASILRSTVANKGWSYFLQTTSHGQAAYPRT